MNSVGVLQEIQKKKNIKLTIKLTEFTYLKYIRTQIWKKNKLIYIKVVLTNEIDSNKRR